MTLLKNKFIAGAATAALSLGGAFGVAHAQDNTVMGAPAQQSASMQQQSVNVPTRNVRGTSEAYLRVLAAEVSLDSVILIVYGNDRNLYDQTKKAAIDATMEGHTVRGILVANGEPAVEIYADAQRYSVYSDPLPVVRNNPDGFLAQTRSRIRHAYTDIIIPRREEAQRLTAAESVPVASR